MSKYKIVNQNGQIGRESNGQFAITTAGQKLQRQAERAQRAEELKSELGGWAESMGIEADDLRGLFA